MVEGSVRRGGERIRINAQLIDATSGSHLWAERYDRQLIDIFAVQDDINQSISAALHQVLRWTATRGAQPRGTLNLAAWDHLLRAMGEPHPRSLRTWTDARENLDRALQLDPGYALAAARLALHLIKAWLFRWTNDRRAITAEALMWAERAVALDSNLGVAHNALAWARFWSGDPDRALEAAEIAMRLAPNDTEAMDRFCLMLCWTGFPDRALEMLPRMTELNPNERYEFLGGVAWFIKKGYETAIDLLETHAEHYPDFLPAYLFLASCNGLLGKYGAAKAAHERIFLINPDYVLDETDVAIFKYPNDRLRFFEGFRLSQPV